MSEKIVEAPGIERGGNLVMAPKQKPRVMAGDVQPFTRSDGTVYYRGRIRLQDGTGRRKWVDPEDPADSADVENVRAFTARMQALEVATATAAAAGTCQRI